MNPAEQVIICPHCQKEIPLTEAVSHQIKAELRQEFEAQAAKREQALTEKERTLADRSKQLEEARASLEDQLSERLKAEKEKLEIAAGQKAEEAIALRVKDLQEQIDAKAEQLRKAQEVELELRKKQREVEERERALDLEIARRVDEQKLEMREAILKAAADEQRLKDLEKEKQISDMRRQIDDLKRKAEQGSQKDQGEVLELELEGMLKDAFPMDSIEPVPPGVKGADLLHRVVDPAGRCCGTIIWELKRTKSWTDDWLVKLKDDQREVRAETAVLMSTALPKDVCSFGFKNGVWVSDFTAAVPLAGALRLNLMDLSMAKAASVGKGEKMEFLYNYLSGPGFRQRVQAIVESFLQMQKDLEQEKRAMARVWAARDKQIERIISNTAGMYGDVQGIIGASLPQIEALEMEALSAGED
jgi:hypothetical protein